VGPAGLSALAALFDDHRNTRRCWCMAFCATRGQFAAGWVAGGNRRRFESAATSGGLPMGVLASVAGEPIGWCACGPRSRYAGSQGRRRKLLGGRDPGEDEAVWLVACLFVRADHRARGVPYALVRAAVELARQHGALAIEGWPIAGSDRHSAGAFVGRQSMFEDLGFRRVASPDPQRALMRRELTDAPGQQP
jgi:GNAT superfamily N-acetyltransferase